MSKETSKVTSVKVEIGNTSVTLYRKSFLCGPVVSDYREPFGVHGIELDSGPHLSGLFEAFAKFLLLTREVDEPADVFSSVSPSEKSLRESLHNLFEVCKASEEYLRIEFRLKNVVFGNYRVAYFRGLQGELLRRAVFKRGQAAALAILFMWPHAVSIEGDSVFSYAPLLPDGTVLPEIMLSVPAHLLSFFLAIDTHEMRRILRREGLPGKITLRRLWNKIMMEAKYEGS